jgi:Haemolymph juvenile hormone binding protein (JHBP)
VIAGDRMNDFLNENWQELTKELGPPIAEALSAATNHRMEALMRLVPVDEIFPEKSDKSDKSEKAEKPVKAEN